MDEQTQIYDAKSEAATLSSSKCHDKLPVQCCWAGKEPSVWSLQMHLKMIQWIFLWSLAARGLVGVCPCVRRQKVTIPYIVSSCIINSRTFILKCILYREWGLLCFIRTCHIASCSIFDFKRNAVFPSQFQFILMTNSLTHTAHELLVPGALEFCASSRLSSGFQTTCYQPPKGMEPLAEIRTCGLMD